MGRISCILGSMFSSDDGDSGSDEQSPDIPITYVFFNKLSILDLKYRFHIRGLLAFILSLCFLSLYRLALLIAIPQHNSPDTPPFFFLIGLFLLVAISAILSYLFLVYIDSRRWSLVHPTISWGVSRLRLNREFKIILIVFNICILIMVAILFLTGSLLSEFGLRSIIVFAAIWFIVHYVIIKFFSIQQNE